MVRFWLKMGVDLRGRDATNRHPLLCGCLWEAPAVMSLRESSKTDAERIFVKAGSP
jgi:hypothetical protein